MRTDTQETQLDEESYSSSGAVALARRISAGTRKAANWVQLVKFGLVGGSGYVINLVVLQLLLMAELPELQSQAIAVAVAMPFNFLGNKLWTFD